MGIYAYVNSMRERDRRCKVPVAITSTIITSSQLQTTDRLRREGFMRADESIRGNIRFHHMIDAISRYCH